ncbi:MAG: hypothetical protein U1F25_14715 [Rubrivivax sp.]
MAVVDRAGITQALRPLRRPAHGGHRDGQGVDGGELSHRHHGARRRDAARAPDERPARAPALHAAGGGIVIQGGGNIFGAIGVSGGPGGAGRRAALAGLAAIREAVEFWRWGSRAGAPGAPGGGLPPARSFALRLVTDFLATCALRG